MPLPSRSMDSNTVRSRTTSNSELNSGSDSVPELSTSTLDSIDAMPVSEDAETPSSPSASLSCLSE
jgi:hypothetical protein